MQSYEDLLNFLFSKVIEQTRKVLAEAERVYGVELKWRVKFEKELKKFLKRYNGRVKRYPELLGFTMWCYQIVSTVCGAFGIGIHDNVRESLLEQTRKGVADIDERILKDDAARKSLEQFRLLCIEILRMQFFARAIECPKRSADIIFS